MARVHGKSANYSINGIDIEGELKEIRMDVEVPEGSITSFGDVYQNFLAGKKSVRTEVTGLTDPDAAAGDATILAMINSGSPVTGLFDPIGDGPGGSSPVFTCTASGLIGVLVGSYRVSMPVGGPGEYRATFQHSGLTTRATS